MGQMKTTGFSGGFFMPPGAVLLHRMATKIPPKYHTHFHGAKNTVPKQVPETCKSRKNKAQSEGFRHAEPLQKVTRAGENAAFFG
ncbi:MAG: hypothetical protein PUD38_03480 [Firmicutes bacterium]|nr:hypothetical protein [Bacillota bacterium]